MKCYAKDYCKGWKTEKCNELCNLYVKLNAIYAQSNIPQRYRYNIPLRPQTHDKANFLQLKEFQDNIINHVENGDNLFIFSPTTGNGKAQPLYSKVLTPEGFKQMGNIKKGDIVFTVDGTTTKVTEVFPQGKKEVYTLTFSDGSTTECCKEHLWTVQKYSGWNTLELQDIMDKPLYAQGKTRRWKYKIPMCEPIQFKEQEVKLDPYILGLLLGDGTLNQTSILFTNSEQDIIDKLQIPNIELHQIDKINYRLIDKNTTNVGGKYGTNTLSETLRQLGLKGTVSETKFIPQEYKINSVGNRLAILQGLVDSDGYVANAGGFVEYVTISKQLAEDVKFIVQSLGGTCSWAEKIPTYTHLGQKRQGQLAYRLGIKLPDNLVPFTSKKHLAKYTGVRQRPPYRKLVNIEYKGYEECQCIMVNHESHLYITDNFIVTHNTAWSTKIANQYIRKTVAKSRLENDVIYMNVSEFLSDVRDQFTNHTTEFLAYKDNLVKCKLLIMDDIGAEKPSDWVRETLYNIINNRYMDMKSTIFTSNCTPEQLESQLGNRIKSRVCSSEIVSLKGFDRRDSNE
ncbi:DarB-like antirestriction [Clostridium phage phi8074-B1]|uniref:DarB-like antirestriction n=1 Tax=Clostridium phage phi8074-B1 TaxID=1147137 RepID=UPI00025C0C5D|nr:DarB-like antirestriction [Clostridium phage phi8074-B1]AFC61974.1 hypothetical protein phi8074-B1_00042 [Clostridium phage phi8074-B1]